MSTGFKFLCKDSKYTYSLNITTNWVYRRKNDESDRKKTMYMEQKNFISHDEIKSMYKNVK